MCVESDYYSHQSKIAEELRDWFWTPDLREIDHVIDCAEERIERLQLSLAAIKRLRSLPLDTARE